MSLLSAWRARARVAADRAPPGWDDNAADAEHARHVVGGAEAVPFAPCVGAEIEHAFDAAEAEHMRRLSLRLDYPAWCRGQRFFSAEHLMDRPMPGRGGTAVRPDEMLVSERSFRQKTRKFVPGWLFGAAVSAGREGLKAARIPDGFNSSFEVPYGLKVGAPAPTRWRSIHTARGWNWTSRPSMPCGASL